MNKYLLIYLILALSIIGSSCVSLNKKMVEHSFSEAQWIRNGEPIVFEGEKWFPRDVIENLHDDEMLNIFIYNEENVYIEKREVRPYNRLYTKFGKYQYRLFEKND